MRVVPETARSSMPSSSKSSLAATNDAINHPEPLVTSMEVDMSFGSAPKAIFKLPPSPVKLVAPPEEPSEANDDVSDDDIFQFEDDHDEELSVSNKRKRSENDAQDQPAKKINMETDVTVEASTDRDAANRSNVTCPTGNGWQSRDSVLNIKSDPEEMTKSFFTMTVRPLVMKPKITQQAAPDNAVQAKKGVKNVKIFRKQVIPCVGKPITCSLVSSTGSSKNQTKSPFDDPDDEEENHQEEQPVPRPVLSSQSNFWEFGSQERNTTNSRKRKRM